MIAVNTRISHAAMVQRLSDLSVRLDDLQGQISTSKRVNAPADDPVAFTRVAVLRRSDAAGEAVRRGIDAASRRLTATDSALETITNLVQRARELALQGSNATASADDRAILATEVGELFDQFRGLADARGSDGERLFGGAAGDRPAYAVDAAGVYGWLGAGRAPAVAAGDGLVAGGIEGPEAFGTTDPATGAQDLFATLQGLAQALVDPDRTTRTAGLDAALAGLDGHVTRLADARATAGARLARLESETTRLDRASLATHTDISRLEDLDLTTALAGLQRLATVLQAAQGSFVRTSSLSLWELLR